MILTVEDFLEAGELESLRRLFEELESRAGHESAGTGLAESKNNVEMRVGERADEIRALVLAACNRAPMLNYALLPKSVSTPILSSYEIGMQYGTHTDSAVGEDRGRLYRTDLSCTIFLDDPGSYDGGELVIETDTGQRGVKLPAGGAVFYPTLFLHRVAPVERGRRRACVFWMESLVRDAGQRAILFDLAQLGAWVARNEPIESEPRRKLVQIRENLYRMWMEI